MAALSGKLTKNLVRTLGPGRHGDGSGLYLVVESLSNATRLGDMAALQDLAAGVMQRYALDIERGNKKKLRLEAGANYPHVLNLRGRDAIY